MVFSEHLLVCEVVETWMLLCHNSLKRTGIEVSSLSLSFSLSLSPSLSLSLLLIIHSYRNLSKRLSSLRERRSSMTSSGGNTQQRTNTSSGHQKDSTPPPSGNSLPDRAGINGAVNEPLSVEEQLRKRNAYLQGRVDVLQEQNRQLGHCIHELRSFTDMVCKYSIQSHAVCSCRQNFS